jgi:dehydrogenase/reductase SDR family member 1
MPIALVTGASRGVGRGIAIALADAGFEVHATGRNILRAELPPSIHRIVCDHSLDTQTRDVFDALPNGVDLLVNCAWGGYEQMVEEGKFTWGLPFWEQPDHRWESMMTTGVRGAFSASVLAAKGMVVRRQGLIVNIGFWAAQKYVGNTIYGIAKAATDKMTQDMAHDLKPFGVAVISLYPGLVRTESVLEAAKAGWLNLSNSESPEFCGRVIAVLYGERALKQTGCVLVAAAVAQELGIIDVDGTVPKPLTLRDV